MPEMLNFGGGGTPAKRVFEITSFAGIDLSSAPADVDKKRSQDAPNMMPDSIGNPVKRPGFSVAQHFEGRINGSFALGEHRVIHAGDSLYYDGEKIWDGMADEISSGQVVEDKLYIFDGFEALVFDGNDAHPITDVAYVPTVLISKNADKAEREIEIEGDGVTKRFSVEHRPEEITNFVSTGTSTQPTIDGDSFVFEAAPAEGEKMIVTAKVKQEPGGAGKESFNLLSRRWKESFYCDTGTEKEFTLSKTGLSEEAVTAFVMDENGEWQEKVEGTDFSVDREAGKITFNAAVTKTPIIGTDNLVIEAAKYFEGYENRINLCTKSITYDAGGASSRIFVCGNPQEPNRDFWCAAGDPTYWPDTFYSEICAATGKILGYSIIEGYLGAHIAPAFDGRSIVLRNMSTDEEGNVSFPIVKHLQGEEAFGMNSFVYMEREPLFLTKRGVYAITAEDVSGEKYTQNRSFYINKVLCADENLEKAFCAKWKQFYCISLGKKLFLLDTSQKSYQRGEPLSSFQYECYLWKDFESRVLWEDNGVLWFGDSEGRICRFVEGQYTDDGKAVMAYWTIPDFFGNYFWQNKTIRTVAIQSAAMHKNEMRLECRKEGVWETLKEWKGKISYFSWEDFYWEEFTFSNDRTFRTVTAKLKIKKFDKVAFRIICDSIDRGFGLYGFSVEYTENGRFKK